MPNFWTSLPKPFLALAPMEGITDFVFREIIAEIAKPDVFFTEFTNTDGLFSTGRDLVIQNLSFTEKQRSIVAQIWGANPKSFFKAAQLISELKFDGIDLNMGCPDKSIVNKKAGAALIKNPNLTQELIKATREGAGNLAVSVKTRIGFDKNIMQEWITFLLEQNLDALTIHGRTGKMRFKGQASWEDIGNAVLIRNEVSPKTIIIGNGDIKSYKEALEKHKNCQVDGVMIGRGILANPWIFNKTTEPVTHTKKEHLEILLRHMKKHRDKWGTTRNFAPIKKFIKMYVNNFPGAPDLRNKLMQCREHTQAERLVTQALSSTLEHS
ncbi:tRNA-dihydrouridine synthase [Patescibacteria group bacterium]|nr:tRNA-dihydrouridine synthase [Patescibacteria group bacterium]